MKQSFLIRFLIFSFCLAGIYFFSRCAKEEQLSPGLAPDFTLRTLDRKEITLSQLKGKVVLLDFWATWCDPCKESIPHFVQLDHKYRENGLELIGINMDRGNIQLVQNFVKTNNISYPVVMASDEVVKNYRVTGIPVSILIDKEGKIRERILGFNSALPQQMIAKVESLLSEEKGPHNTGPKTKE